jgi:FkbM family methyltransferase
LDLIEAVIPRRRRRRWRWYLSTLFQKDTHVQFDGDLDVWSPVSNFTAKQTYVAGYRDPETFAWLDRFLKPGMTVFDVGANVGVYGLFMARRVAPGICYAFEPSPALRPYLEENKRSNGIHNLDLNFVATSDASGTLCFAMDRINHGRSHIASSGGVEVPVVRLDDFVASRGIDRVDFVKIDVEGFELPTLRGLESTLSRDRDIVVLAEVEPKHARRYGYSVSELFSFMQGLGFKAFALEDDAFVAFEDAKRAKDAVWTRNGREALTSPLRSQSAHWN